MKLNLIVSPPGSDPRQFELKGKRIGLGREVDNDICIDVDSVSSSHLEFRKTENSYELIDIGSTNGTRVNGKAIQKTILEDGDRILIGETVPAHFVVLAEGETYADSTAQGSEEEQASAAEYASMSDRLEKLEANIEEKEEEAAQLESRLAELRQDFAVKQAEFQQSQADLDKLQAEIEAKKQGGGAAAEVEEMEDVLVQKTQRVKLMANNLAAQKQTIAQLERSKSESDPSAKPGPVMPKAGPVMPKAGPLKAKSTPLGGKKPLRPAAKTVPLTKKMPKLPRPPRIAKKKRPGA